jgi:hypothetical protein
LDPLEIQFDALRKGSRSPSDSATADSPGAQRRYGKDWLRIDDIPRHHPGHVPRYKEETERDMEFLERRMKGERIWKAEWTRFWRRRIMKGPKREKRGTFIIPFYTKHTNETVIIIKHSIRRKQPENHRE